MQLLLFLFFCFFVFSVSASGVVLAKAMINLLVPRERKLITWSIVQEAF